MGKFRWPRYHLWRMDFRQKTANGINVVNFNQSNDRDSDRQGDETGMGNNILQIEMHSLIVEFRYTHKEA